MRCAQEGRRRRFGRPQQRGFERRGDQCLQVAATDLGVRILGPDDLALFCHPQLAADRPRWLRKDRFIARAAATPHRAATAVKHPQLDIVRSGEPVEQQDQRDFGAVQLPVAGEDAAVLVAVAVAEHDLLLGARAPHQIRDSGQGVELAHDRRRVAQVADGFEQWHDDQVRRGFCIERSGQQSDFLLQQHHFEQVADGLGVADDVVTDGLRAELVAHPPGHFKNGKLVAAVLRINGPHDAQGPGVGQQFHQQNALVVLGQLAVTSLDPSGREQFRNDQFVLVRALPQVDSRQMETEYLHGANQRMQTLRYQGLCVMRQQRCADGCQIGQELLGAWIGILRRHRMPRRLAAGEGLERRGQARVDPGQGPPVGLVLAMFVGVGGAFGQCLHFRAHVHQQGRERQLAPEVVDLGQVVAQGHFGLPPQRILERLGAHVRVAVAVAADPLAHAQEARDRLLAKLPLQVGVELGNLAQERRFIVAQRVLDLVGHRQPGKAQQAGLPELDHARADLQFVGGQLARRQRILGQCLRLDLVARDQQVRDVALRVQNALALDFGGMRGKHWRQVGVR